MKIIKYLYAKIKTKLIKGLTMFLVDTKNKNIITFKNGSVVECVKIKDGDETIRGHRSKYIYPYYNDFEFNEEEFNKAIEPYLKTQ